MMLQQLKPDKEFNEEVFETTFNALDKDHSGTVSLEELTSDFIQKAKD